MEVFSDEAAVGAEEAALLSAIVDEGVGWGPARLVYADWLQERGSARGELMMVQHSIDDLLSRHPELRESRGAVGNLVQRIRRAFPQGGDTLKHYEELKARELSLQAALNVEWLRYFVPPQRRFRGPAPVLAPLELVGGFFPLPLASGADDSFVSLHSALHRYSPFTDMIHVQITREELDPVNASGLLARFVAVSLGANQTPIAGLANARLDRATRLEVKGIVLGDSGLEELVSAYIPNLETLSLGWGTELTEATPAILKQHLPTLRELDLRGSVGTFSTWDLGDLGTLSLDKLVLDELACSERTLASLREHIAVVEVIERELLVVG